MNDIPIEHKIDNHPCCPLCFHCKHMIGAEVKKSLKGTYRIPKCELTLFKSFVIGFDENQKCNGFEPME